MAAPTTPREALEAFAAYLEEHATDMPLSPALIAQVARDRAAELAAEAPAADLVPPSQRPVHPGLLTDPTEHRGRRVRLVVGWALVLAGVLGLVALLASDDGRAPVDLPVDDVVWVTVTVTPGLPPAPIAGPVTVDEDEPVWALGATR
jgi:hypothetical protein